MEMREGWGGQGSLRAVHLTQIKGSREGWARDTREPASIAPVSLGCLTRSPACINGLMKTTPNSVRGGPPHQWGAQSVKKEAKAGLPGWDSGTGLPRE